MPVLFLVLEPSDLGFVSDFVIRFSNFESQLKCER